MSRILPGPSQARVIENPSLHSTKLDSVDAKILQEAFDGDEAALMDYRAEALAQPVIEGHLIQSITFDI